MISRFNRIFEVFSRRPKQFRAQKHDVPETFRNRVFLWCNEVFSNSRTSYGSGDYISTFWEEIHRHLQYSLGRVQLLERNKYPASRAEDAIEFLLDCPSDEFIDFVEYIFRVDCFFHVAIPENELVDEINELFRIDDLPYHVTYFAKEKVREIVNAYPFTGREQEVIKTVAYPKVIMKESEVLHAQAIQPTLEFLQKPAFKLANGEFLEALEDYRKGDFGDCLTKCGSSFESVLKIICERKNWPYRQTDTASSLIKTFLENAQIEGYLEPVLMIVATLRNRLSKSHGAGQVPKNVPRHLAHYAINVTASSILLIVDESGIQ